jgi:hypothetical protein
VLEALSKHGLPEQATADQQAQHDHAADSQDDNEARVAALVPAGAVAAIVFSLAVEVFEIRIATWHGGILTRAFANARFSRGIVRQSSDQLGWAASDNGIKGRP